MRDKVLSGESRAILTIGKVNTLNTILPEHVDWPKNKCSCFSESVTRFQLRRMKVQHEKRNGKVNIRPWLVRFPPGDGRKSQGVPGSRKGIRRPKVFR